MVPVGVENVGPKTRWETPTSQNHWLIIITPPKMHCVGQRKTAYYIWANPCFILFHVLFPTKSQLLPSAWRQQHSRVLTPTLIGMVEICHSSISMSWVTVPVAWSVWGWMEITCKESNLPNIHKESSTPIEPPINASRDSSFGCSMQACLVSRLQTCSVCSIFGT